MCYKLISHLCKDMARASFWVVPMRVFLYQNAGEIPTMDHPLQVGTGVGYDMTFFSHRTFQNCVLEKMMADVRV